MTERRYKFWGWGYEDQVPEPEDAAETVQRISSITGLQAAAAMPWPEIGRVDLAEPRVTVPQSLEPITSLDTYDRAAHTYGKSFPDYVRAFAHDFTCAPDLVLRPRNVGDIVAILDWASDANVAVIPFGAGSNVVGGVEPAVGDGFSGVATMDLRKLNRVREVDVTGRTAQIEAGALGPVLERQLKPHGLTLRHFPQSFEFSTLGGWIATRSGGHFATLHTHIEDLVQSLRVVAPRGTLETRRLPGSGAGPSADRFFAGSEGSMGIITSAWMRVVARPIHRRSAAIWFDGFLDAAAAVRAVVQANLWPANCRVVDAEEARIAGAGDGARHLLVLGFENADRSVDPWMKEALRCATDHGGVPDENRGDSPNRAGVAGIWRNAFIRAPYVREMLIAHGIIVDTVETAITWDRFPEFHHQVKRAIEEAIRRATGVPGHVTCRFTHAYTDGPAPYFTFHAQAPQGGALQAWREIKIAASEALMDAGGTITHHHAVGREHMPWYTKQRPALFGTALAAAKREFDPTGILNPGVLIGHAP